MLTIFLVIFTTFISIALSIFAIAIACTLIQTLIEYIKKRRDTTRQELILKILFGLRELGSEEVVMNRSEYINTINAAGRYIASNECVVWDNINKN